MGAQAAAAIQQSSALLKELLESSLPQTGLEQVFGQRLWKIFDLSVDEHVGLLPLITCQASGGESSQAIPLVAAWRSLRLSAKLLDDLADGESLYAPAEAIDLASSLLFLAPLALKELVEKEMPPDKVERLTKLLFGAGLQACAGQHAEVATFEDARPDDWLAIAGAKSGAPCAWAAWAGALVAGADEGTLISFREYGMHCGILLQVADDFNGIWSDNDSKDLRSRQLNLAVCYARLVAEVKQRNQMEKMLKAARQGNGPAEHQMKHFLIDMGAQAYLLVVGRRERQEAIAALGRHGHLFPSLIDFLDEIWPAIGKEAEGERHSG